MKFSIALMLVLALGACGFAGCKKGGAGKESGLLPQDKQAEMKAQYETKWKAAPGSPTGAKGAGSPTTPAPSAPK